jgi:hypothetical protein
MSGVRLVGDAARILCPQHRTYLLVWKIMHAVVTADVLPWHSKYAMEHESTSHQLL